ncbi:MAG: HAD hydrolase-like protein [Proteobacteria bacterium]|nr:HAD hydrolase-like protein [Pseudomonadota bacterium]
MIKDIVNTAEVIIFDCDGVLMDSNPIKENAFYQVALGYFGRDGAEFIQDFHRKNGGLSRQVKFSELMRHYRASRSVDLETLCIEFETELKDSLLKCKLAAGLESVLESLLKKGKKLLVLSGTPEPALKSILDSRKLAHYFVEILGSPTLKPTHLLRLHKEAMLDFSKTFVFVGDSLTDKHAADEFSNCQFYWSTEFAKCDDINVKSISSLQELVP